MRRALCAAALALAAAAGAASFPPLRVENGVVSSGSLEASQAGAAMLRAGGDAADAAVAVMAGLGVGTPISSGLGGGCFLVVYRAAEDRTYVLDAREVAPAAAHRDMYLRDGEPRPELAKWGGLAVGVPGEVKGMEALHQRWGKLAWRDLFRPAARAAREGVAITRYMASAWDYVHQRVQPYPAARDLYMDAEGNPRPQGEVFKNPALADTLDQLGERGAAWFYTGGMAGEMAAAAQAAGGVLTAADLAAYRVRERTPVVGRFHDFTVVSMPPPSSGGAVILEILQVLERFDLERMGLNSSAYLHTLAEAMKHAFADRARYMGDPDFVDVPVQRLTSEAYAAELARKIHPLRTREVDAYLHPLPEDGGTAHFSVVDAAGNVVAGTTTINYALGSLVVVPGRGFPLNNQMDDFSIAPGVANVFGLVGGDANSVAPGKKPLSSMSPTIVFRDGRPWAVAGASGGPRIITGTLQALLNMMVFGLDVQAAVDAPRIHHQWKPDTLRVERGIPRDVVRALEARGHDVDAQLPSIRSRVQAVRIHEGFLEAAADPRKGGTPAGY